MGNFKIVVVIYCVCAHFAYVHRWKLEDSFWELTVPTHHVHPRG